MMAAVGKTLEPVTRRSSFVSRRLLLMLLILFLCASAIVAIVIITRGSDVDRGTRALVSAFTKRRLIEPWLSGGFKAGSFNPSSDRDSEILIKEFDRGRELITDAMARDESSARVPYARLLLTRSEKLTEAQKYLRRALASAPNDPEAHNDLGVCLIQQGKLEDALDEFHNSLQLKPNMHEALFNRALCYQRLLLKGAATKDYNRLLEIDLDSSWRKEVEQRREQLSSQLSAQQRESDIVAALHSALAERDFDQAKRIIGSNFEVSVKHALFTGSAEYLKAAVRHEAEQADRTLLELKWIGDYTHSRGDACLTDITTYLTALPQQELEQEYRLINEYLASEKLFQLKRYSEGQTAFNRLSEQFALRGNYAFKHFSDVYVANCLYANDKLGTALKRTQEALAFVEGRQWPFMRALRLSELSVIYSRLDQDSFAIAECEKAKRFGEGARLVQAKASQSLGNAYWRLGNLDKALAELRESTNLYLTGGTASADLANNYLQIGDIYRLSGNHRLGMLFAKESFDLANIAQDYRRAAQASSWLAVEQARLGQFEEASDSLKLAFDQEQQYEHNIYTKQIVLSRAGEVAALRGDTETAAQFYSKAEAVLESAEEKTIPLLSVLRGRAEAYERAKQFDKAGIDLERAISGIEGYRSNISDTQNRSAFMDASQSVFDHAIKLNIEAFDRKAKAFELTEESRARVLLEELSSSNEKQQSSSSSTQSGPGNISGLANVQASLPEGLRIVSYSVTSERTYIFLITRDDFSIARSPATTETLDRLVREYVSLLKNLDSSDQMAERGAKLYEYLISPVEGVLEDGKAVCIVPDKALHFLPFAALIDGSGHYFVESHRLSYAPSAAVLVRSLEEARSKGRTIEERILSVGNPHFSRQGFPLLKDLPDAEREARETSAAYTNKKLLTGTQATESEVREQLKNCDVAHLAVHCIVAEKSPWLAALVLTEPAKAAAAADSSNTSVRDARTSTDDGLLYLKELYGVSMPRARLVVLSACETALGQYYRGEGIVSLIRPFLAARVPTVVASLWAVDSRATAELMIELHRERRANTLGAGDALRASQIKMIGSEQYRHPYYWAPFISVGAS
jgi:CHAT domain-containing protein/Flp pilus assembly protein TadD